MMAAPDIAETTRRPASAAGGGTLLIGCGALAREMLALIEAHGWRDMAVTCLPAHYHNTPQKIPAAVQAKIRENRDRYARIFVLYGDCGTGGGLDEVLAAEGVERIAGAHCYEFFATTPFFTDMADAEPASFYLTDFLARHFDRLVWKGLGIDRHPELLPLYFGNYRRLVYLAQTDAPELRAKAKAAAERLGLAYEYRFTGYGDLQSAVSAAAASSVLLPIRAAAGYRLRNGQRDDLLIADVARRSWPRDSQRVHEHVGCDNEGLQRSGHLEPQSRVGKAGGPLLMSPAVSCPTAQPASSL